MMGPDWNDNDDTIKGTIGCVVLLALFLVWLVGIIWAVVVLVTR